MNLPVSDLLKLLPLVGPAVAQTVEFAARFEELIAHKSVADQDELREALAEIRADNDEGHGRLQRKLRQAIDEGR